VTIPFLHYFKKSPQAALAQKTAAAVASKATTPIAKPSNERFSKTVMPNTTRTIGPQDPFQMAARSSAMGGTMPSANGGAPAPRPEVPRTIAFGASAPGQHRDLPPAVALALEPKVERVIALDLADVIAFFPPGHLKPAEHFDGSSRILVKACEVERGMSNGKPTVSLASIHQQMPEIFVRRVEPSDVTQVELPFAKVLEQFTNLHVRDDQERHQPFPQIETPFLQVALEDNIVFGTTMAPIQTSDLSPVRVELATAQTLAYAQPEAAADEKFPAPASTISLPRMTDTSASPTRIPFKLSPNGPGVPASESVPASSGPSVPTAAPGTPGPTRIPFKMSVPEPWLTPENPMVVATSEAAAAPAAPSVSDAKIVLALKPILQGLPPFQLNGDPDTVPAETRIEFPFSLVEPQLASGRIVIAPKVFHAQLPEEYRSLFNAEAEHGDVSLPLPEVMKNLTTSLRMRDDQEEQEAGSNFATPFSAKAEEDSKRLQVSGAPVAKPTPVAAGVSPASPVVVGVSPASHDAANTAAATAEIQQERPLRTPLQVALETDDAVDAKSVIALLNKIPGVNSSAILFGDGLSLAGSLPAELETEGLCAMAPSLMQRVENHMIDTKLGPLRGMTLTTPKHAITFFLHDNLCLAAVHASGDLTNTVREKLQRIVHELSRKYSHPV